MTEPHPPFRRTACVCMGWGLGCGWVGLGWVGGVGGPQPSTTLNLTGAIIRDSSYPGEAGDEAGGSRGGGVVRQKGGWGHDRAPPPFPLHRLCVYGVGVWVWLGWVGLVVWGGGSPAQRST